MSDEPREFWISPGEHGDYMGTRETISYDNEILPPEEEKWGNDFYSCISAHKFKDGIHVIEKSAYDKLKADNAKLKKERDGYEELANQWMRDHDDLKDKYEPTEIVYD